MRNFELNMTEDRFKIEIRGLGKDYFAHEVFELLDNIIAFYEFLSMNSEGASGVLLSNKLGINSLIYSSIQGTIESIKYLSLAGHFSDAFAIARKYEDAMLTDLYANILIRDDEEEIMNPNILIKEDEEKIMDEDDKIAELLNNSEVRTWILNRKPYLFGNISNADAKIVKRSNPEYGELTELNNLLERYKSEPREICNDNVHYNSLKNYAYNSYNYIAYNNRGVELLDKLYNLILDVFTKHFSYTYMMKPDNFVSCDYIYAKEEGEEPEEGSEYWVASIVQDVFDKYIKTKRKDVANYLINNGTMKLE